MQKLYLRLEQRLAAPPNKIFQFFCDAKNLEILTPPWLHFRVLSAHPAEIRRGTLIDYNLRVRGIPMRWQSEITEWSPPDRFIDAQRRGPYRHWVHTHTFEAIEGGALARDEIAYSVWGGKWVQQWLVEPDLKRIFQYRQERLAELFGSLSATQIKID